MQIFRRPIFSLTLFLLPTIGIFVLALWMTLFLRYPTGLDPEQLILHIQLFGFIGLLWLALYYGFGLLDHHTHRQPNQLIAALTGCHVMCLIVSMIFFYLQPSLIITPRRFLLVDLLIVFVLSTVWQFTIRSLTKRLVQQTVYFINLEHAYNACKKDLPEMTQGIIIHSIREDELLAITEHTHRNHASLLFVVPSNPIFSNETLKRFAHLHSFGATFMRFEDFYEETFRRVYTTSLNDWWLLEHVHHERVGLYPIVKRVLDLLCACLIAIVFFLTFPAIALLIKLSDRGRIFFTQTRLTVDGTPFTIIKYRTMRAGTPNNTWTEDHDPRVTAIGRFLRITRLDELPQWINILRGDMSLIGPRPEQAGIVEQLREEIPYFESRHAIRPGLIGWAQLHVYAGTVSESQQKLQYDLYYLKHRSFLFDVEILLKTIAHVFFLQGK